MFLIRSLIKTVVVLSLTLLAGVFLVRLSIREAVKLPPRVSGLLNYYWPCLLPIRYRIGEVDPLFHLSRAEFLAAAERAAGPWNGLTGNRRLVYDPAGWLTVNLIYDERQSLATQTTQTESQLQKDLAALSPTQAKYDQLVADFNSRMTELNAQIKEWNGRGGAPPDVYQKLTQEQADLQAEAGEINALARQLNLSAAQYNDLVDRLNQTVGSFNQLLTVKPEGGLYDPNRAQIDIYFDLSPNELEHILAHEFGHALGLGHDLDPASLMYPYADAAIQPSLADRTAVVSLCAAPWPTAGPLAEIVARVKAGWVLH